MTISSGDIKGIIRAEDSAEAVAIVDIIVIEVAAGIIAGYPRIVVVVLLAKPLFRYFIFTGQSLPKLGMVSY